MSALLHETAALLHPAAPRPFPDAQRQAAEAAAAAAAAVDALHLYDLIFLPGCSRKAAAVDQLPAAEARPPAPSRLPVPLSTCDLLQFK